MEKIIIIGGKGSAVVVAEQIYDAQKKTGEVEFLGFAFDDEKYGSEINGFPVLSKTTEVYEKYKKYEDIKFIYQLYRPDLIRERIELLNSYNIPLKRFAKFVHPSAVISQSVKIGFGSAIMAYTVINSNASIGNHCTIHSNSLIGHDTKIGDYNFFAAHSVIGSNNSFGNGSFIGLNSTFNNYLTIGDYCFIGMASNVIKSIPTGLKVLGNPAKPYNKQIKPL
ncbi:hypothetical protein ACE01N_06030 [Saccharicrinis sp. FJH2]|uniref:hypothetical protein n=1 Tax=Saccharicrinis sp. FJH65 TaxID=3344659 RepID=UPI0035F459DE